MGVSFGTQIATGDPETKETQVNARALIITVTSSLALVAPAAHAAGSGAQPARSLQAVVLGDGAAAEGPGRQATTVKRNRVAVDSPFGPHHFQALRNSI